jgi:hypothetical protein
MVRSSYKNKKSKQQRNHTIKIRGGTVKCPYCQRSVVSEEILSDHCRIVHNRSPPVRTRIPRYTAARPRPSAAARPHPVAALPVTAARPRPSAAARPHPVAALPVTARPSAAIAAAAAYAEYDDLGDPPTEAFKDPITYGILIDPVVASDGFTYERSTINEINGKSPFTREALTGKLIPNRSIKSAIDTWMKAITAKNQNRVR